MSPVSASANLVRRTAAQLADLPEVVGRNRPTPDRRPAERPTLLVVPGPRRKPNRRLWAAVGLLCGFAVFFALAVFQTMLVEHQQELDRLDKQVALEQTKYSKAQFAEAQAESPEHIVAAAKQMGMVPAIDRKWLAPSPEAAAAAQAVPGDEEPAAGSGSTGDNGVPVAEQPEVKKSFGSAR